MYIRPISLIVGILVFVVAAGYYFYSDKMKLSSCDFSGIDVNTFLYRDTVPTLREMARESLTFTFDERIKHGNVSLKIPFNSEPEVTPGYFTRITSSEGKTLTLGQNDFVEQLDESIKDSGCGVLVDQWKSWSLNKSEQQIVHDLLYLEDQSDSLQSDSFTTLLFVLKSNLISATPIYEMTSEELHFYQFGTPNLGSINIFNLQGEALAMIIYKGLTQEEIDYMLNSIQESDVTEKI